MKLLITFGIGFAGGYLGLKRKIPAGAMIGAMLAVAVFNIFTGCALFPTSAKIFTQIISGIFVGCKITRSELSAFHSLIKPAILNMSMIILACVLMGLFLYKVSDYNLATCLFATAPGSLTDMAIISIDMGADTSVVSVLQTVRLMTIVGIFPLIFGIILKKTTTPKKNKCASESFVKSPKKESPGMHFILITAFVAAFSGGTSYLIGIPAGALIGSMAGVSIWNVCSSKAYMPLKMKQFAQICAGILIGESITVDVLKNLKYTILPAILMMVCLLVIVILLALLLHKTSGLDFPTALFSCAPGGASDLALLAEDFGADTPKVSLIQTLRVVCVVIFYPLIINFLNNVL